MQHKPRVDDARNEANARSKTSFPSGPLARHYCLALSTVLLSAVAFFCTLASGLSCSFISVSLSNPSAVIDLNATNNIPAEDQWYYDELLSENNDALSVGILCQGDLDWLAPNTSDNSMRSLSKVFFIVALVLGSILLIVTCGISTFLPTSDLIWDGISYVAAGLFVCEMPIFFLLDSPPCNDRRMFSCQLGSGSYSLIVSMVVSLSLAILTQWKNPPDWKEEYEIWNLRRRNEEMTRQRELVGRSTTHEENWNNEDEEFGRINDQSNQRQQQQSRSRLQDKSNELELDDEIVSSTPKRNQTIDKGKNQFMGQVIDVNPRSQKQNNSTSDQNSPTRSHAPSVSTEVYGSDHGRNVMKEPSTPDHQYSANEIPLSPLSICTGLSDSPRGRTTSPAPSPKNDYASPTANNISNITDKATFMESDIILDEPEDFAASYLVNTSAKMLHRDDASVKSASKQSIVSKMKDKLWKSSNDGQIQSSVFDADREEVQESWMVEDVSVGNSGEVFFDPDKMSYQSAEPHRDLTESQEAPPIPEPTDTEKDIAGLIVPGMISQMKEQVLNKPVVSPERVRDPEIDMYPSESSVSELSLPNVEDEEYLKRIEVELGQAKSKPAEPILNIPVNYQSDSSVENNELHQVIAGVQKINRKISGKITPLNRRARRRKVGGGSVSGDSYSSAQGSLLDEVIIEEGENFSTEISIGSADIPTMITPENKTSRHSNQGTTSSCVYSFDDDDGYQNEKSAEEENGAQSVTSSVASARRHRLALNRKFKTETDSIASAETDGRKSILEDFLNSEVVASNEEKVKLLQEALDRLQKKSPDEEGYVSTAKSEKSQQSLIRVNQRYVPKAETVDLPLNGRHAPHAQDVNTGAAPVSDRNQTSSAWQARKARLRRLRMLRAEEEKDSPDDIIRANKGSVACASDEGSI